MSVQSIRPESPRFCPAEDTIDEAPDALDVRTAAGQQAQSTFDLRRNPRAKEELQKRALLLYRTANMWQGATPELREKTADLLKEARQMNASRGVRTDALIDLNGRIQHLLDGLHRISGQLLMLQDRQQALNHMTGALTGAHLQARLPTPLLSELRRSASGVQASLDESRKLIDANELDRASDMAATIDQRMDALRATLKTEKVIGQDDRFIPAPPPGRHPGTPSEPRKTTLASLLKDALGRLAGTAKFARKAVVRHLPLRPFAPGAHAPSNRPPVPKNVEPAPGLTSAVSEARVELMQVLTESAARELPNLRKCCPRLARDLADLADNCRRLSGRRPVDPRAPFGDIKAIERRLTTMIARQHLLQEVERGVQEVSRLSATLPNDQRSRNLLRHTLRPFLASCQPLLKQSRSHLAQERIAMVDDLTGSLTRGLQSIEIALRLSAPTLRDRMIPGAGQAEDAGQVVLRDKPGRRAPLALPENVDF